MELSLDLNAHELIKRCQQGDAGSYRLLYDRYAQPMYNTALRILNNNADATEVLRESFIDAFRTLSRYRNHAMFGDWLKKMVVSKCIERIKGSRKTWVEVDIKHIDSYSFQGEPDVQEDDFVFSVEGIRKGVRLLPDGYRTVLSLYLIEGYREEEIAAMLGISPATVTTQYRRAKKKLMDILRQNEKK